MSAINPTAPSGSAIGGNVAPSATGGNTAPAQKSSINTAPSYGGGSATNTSIARPANPTISFDNITGHPTTGRFDVDAEMARLSDLYANIMYQKLTAEMLRNMVASENEEFQNWAGSLDNVELANITNLDNFLATLDSGEFTNDPTVNAKLQKVLSYVPDILETLTKKEGLGLGIKLAEGESPVVDYAKYSIEKVIAPAMEKLGNLLASRFSTGAGKNIAEALVEWGGKLKTLPSRILSSIGVYDIAASALDAILIAVDKATGNQRETNHQLPEWLTGIPVIGQISSSLMSVRDLIDTAAGIPTNQEGANILQNQLYNDLWNPMMNEQNDILSGIASQEAALGDQKTSILRQADRDGVQQQVESTISEIIDRYGGDLGTLTDAQLNELDIPYDDSLLASSTYRGQLDAANNNLAALKSQRRQYSQRLTDLQQSNAPDRATSGIVKIIENLDKQIYESERNVKTLTELHNSALQNDSQQQAYDDIQTIIRRELGLISAADADAALVDIPELNPLPNIISPAELEGRIILDNLFAGNQQLAIAQGYVNDLESKVADADGRAYEQAVILSQAGGTAYEYGIASRERKKALADAAKYRAELERVQNSIPNLETQLTAYQGELQDLLTSAEAEGVDLSFLEQSANFDEMLAAIQDDTPFWENVGRGFEQAVRGYNPFYVQ